MRKLTEQELERIHARLKSLYIRYTEVYQEIFDHYCTTLENSPAIESPAIIAKLNETFAWSVVKNMDKELERNVSQKVTTGQLAYLKFWNFGVKGFLIAFGVVVGVVLSVMVAPEPELIIISLFTVFITSLVAKYILGKKLSFTLKHKPIDIWPSSITKRVSLFSNIFIWLYFMPRIFLREESISSQLYSIATVLLTFIGLVYVISLFAVASNLPKSKLI